jgi:hypothetical protein
MNRKMPQQMSDEENTSFTAQSTSVNATGGFDPGEQHASGRASKGQHRFPRRKSEAEIPQESLAERLRARREGN